MKSLKRIAAVLSAALLIGSLSIGASAAVTDEQKKEITDALFENMWRGSLENFYWRKTDSTVPIRDNPLAATTYMTIEAEVAVCNNTLLERVYSGEVDLRDFYKEDDEYDYTKAKKINKYANSMLQGYEMSPVDFVNGVWEMNDHINGGKFYGYFREDEKNFKLYDNDTNELLGTYPRLLDFDYLDDEEGSGGGGGGAGGGAGRNNNSELNNASAETSNGNKPTESSITSSSFTQSSITTSETSDKKSPYDSSRYDTDNPAVTPEIASAVDAMKSSAEKAEEDMTVSHVETKPNHTPTIILAVVVGIVIGAAAFFLAKKNKGSSQK